MALWDIQSLTGIVRTLHDPKLELRSAVASKLLYVIWTPLKLRHEASTKVDTVNSIQRSNAIAPIEFLLCYHPKLARPGVRHKKGIN